jgi:plastocyanin
MKKLPIALLLLGLAAAVPTAGAATKRRVVLQDVAYSPSTLRVSKGTTVRWVWRDGAISHDVSSRGSRRFKSSATKTRGSHRVTFRRAGTYRYLCSQHPSAMRGKVVVR